MKYSGEKFLTPEEHEKMGKVWSEASRGERHRVGYFMGRKENHQGENFSELQFRGSVDVVHGASFIDQVIPEMIDRKKTGDKVMVLDIGGGAGEYARQLRRKFGENISVCTTGLTKKYAKDSLWHRKGLLTQNDLKWRSVVELSNYPEFDLILDTFGEQYYFEKEKREIVFLYLDAIAAKLREGGIASIAPFLVAPDLREGLFRDIMDRHNVSIAIVPVADKNIGRHDVLRIEKTLS